MNTLVKRTKSTALSKKCNPASGPIKHEKGPTVLCHQICKKLKKKKGQWNKPYFLLSDYILQIFFVYYLFVAFSFRVKPNQF